MPPASSSASARRGVGLTLAALAIVAACVLLGFWQWHRGDVLVTEPAGARPVAAVGQVVSGAAPAGSAAAVLTADEVGRRVRVEGTFDPALNLLVPGRRVDGRVGSWVLGIVRAADSTGVPVIRGWVPQGASAPALPAGHVRIVGAVQAPENSDEAPSTAALPDDEVWVVSAALLINRVDYRVANAYVTDASPAAGLVAVPAADPGQARRHLNWRNLAYAAQWWVFAAFAIVVWARAMRDDRLGGDESEPGGTFRPATQSRRTARHEHDPMSDRQITLGSGTEAKVRSALLRYRVMAWLTGLGLLVLTLIGLPQKYWHWFGGGDSVVGIMGPIHGFLYVVLLVTTFDLGTRVRWPWSRMVFTALAGTIPFLSFYAERKNHRQVHGQLGRR